jgi:threonine dehydrogenase-like Zn-dependent dehydrogenase
MKAFALVPGTKELRLVDRPEPQIKDSDDIKVKIIRVGICGTDREEASGGRADAPPGSNELIIGHEMLGQVVEVGRDVTKVRPGDYAVFTVRRGCGECLPCLMNRSDMCLTGKYKERGIKEMDGYQAEFVVDKEQYIVAIPPQLEKAGVLIEPLTIGVKSIHEAMRIQTSRLPSANAEPDWLYGKRCLVAGLGPVGLLVAMELALKGADLYGLDIVDKDSTRPKWLEMIGGRYIDGRQVDVEDIDTTCGEMDLIFEATGVPKIEFNLIDALGRNGIYTVTGIPGGDRTIEIHGAELMRDIVLKNQIIMGSVNASQSHFQIAVSLLQQAHEQWGDKIEQLITNRYKYIEDFQIPLKQHEPDEIKAVIEWE